MRRIGGVAARNAWLVHALHFSPVCYYFLQIMLASLLAKLAEKDKGRDTSRSAFGWNNCSLRRATWLWLSVKCKVSRLSYKKKVYCHSSYTPTPHQRVSTYSGEKRASTPNIATQSLAIRVILAHRAVAFTIEHTNNNNTRTYLTPSMVTRRTIGSVHPYSRGSMSRGAHVFGERLNREHCL